MTRDQAFLWLVWGGCLVGSLYCWKTVVLHVAWLWQ